MRRYAVAIAHNDVAAARYALTPVRYAVAPICYALATDRNDVAGCRYVIAAARKGVSARRVLIVCVDERFIFFRGEVVRPNKWLARRGRAT